MEHPEAIPHHLSQKVVMVLQKEMKPRGTFGRIRRKQMLVEEARLTSLGTMTTGTGMMTTTMTMITMMEISQAVIC